MQFFEKLTFLLKITQISNRMLARELKVDPSLISRLRTGARGLPRNRDQIRAMASYFAKHCTSEYQRQALCEMLQINPSSAIKTEQLSEILFFWLEGDTDETSSFIGTFEAFSFNSDDMPREMTSKLGTGNSVYYGNAGKRCAVQIFYQHLLTLKKPATVFILADESQEWMSEDFDFNRNLSNWGMLLLKRGFRLCQITPPVTAVNQAFEALRRWLPFYITGQTAPYYYPHIRDDVHKRSLFVVPGEIAVSSNSVASKAGHAAFLTTDKRLIEAYEAEFRDYLSLCRPMLNSYHTPDNLLHCFTKFLAVSGPRYQKLISLSAETSPKELIDYCMRKIKSEHLKKLISMYFQDIELIEKSHEKHTLLEIIPLASAQQVRDSRVPIMFTYGITPSPLYYTPKTYITHLENILKIMESCENYHFIPIPFTENPDSTIMVKEGHYSLLVRTTPPLTVFEISQPDIIRLCREYLMETANKIGYTGVYRDKIMTQLRNLIQELQSDNA